MQHIRQNPMFIFLAVLTVASTVGLQAWQTLFNNFAVEAAGLGGNHVGMIQSVREIPGLLALLVIFVLLIVKEHRLSAMSIVLMGVGISLTGFFPSFSGLLFTTTLMSFGFHYYETTNQSLTLQYFAQNASPWVFGAQRSLAAISSIVVSLLLLILTPHLSYQQTYMLLGASVIGLGLWGLGRNPTDHELPHQNRQMIVRRRYWLFYVLTFFSGARRQIFVVFSAFLLVKRFGYSVQEVTILFAINNAVNYFLSRWVGDLVIIHGERKIITAEYGILLAVLIGYVTTDSKWLAGGLYIVDTVLYNFSMAVRTYFQKIGDKQDTAASMAIGFTINHIAAVVIPALGGWLWLFDYRIPFYGGMGLCLLGVMAAQQIRPVQPR